VWSVVQNALDEMPFFAQFKAREGSEAGFATDEQRGNWRKGGISIPYFREATNFKMLQFLS
jgi:hypothetical protein